MQTFDKYAEYYDLLYADKDYDAECEYIEKLTRLHGSRAQSFLDLGCGTGKHLTILARNAKTACGVDLSQTMIASARQNCPQLNFCCSDIADYRDSKKYDVITSLFHVASYQTGNDQLQRYFETAATHLADNGVFIFDCWYGSGVLSDLPQLRTKNIENERIVVKRVATPTMYPNENCVNVRYDIDIVEKTTGENHQLTENHRMRYLFQPELELFAELAGLKIVASYKWLTETPPDLNTWYACFVLKSISLPPCPNP
ncbi:MAG: class I SAM-dependent methyltransferase [Negativicutes bacterium]|jgi:SAM-dependent methyltransferase